MKRFWSVLCLALLSVIAAGTPEPAPPPTLQATPTPMPSVTPASTPAVNATSAATDSQPEVPADYFPSDMPACKDFEVLGRRPQFDWPTIDKVGTDADWVTYRCGNKPSDLAAFYREKMVQPPYNWLETGWTELPQGTLGVYFHAGFQSWKYLWFLKDPASSDSTILVIADQVDTPMELPCCG